MYIKIGKVAEILNVTTQTLRNWDADGTFKPHHTTDKGTRYYTRKQIDEYLGLKSKEDAFKVIGYCRVSSNGQKDDLQRQVDLMNTYLKYRYDNYRIIEDIGSGINYNKRGLKELLRLINNKEVDLIVVSHKDRLLRFGYELVEYVAELNDVEIKVIEQDDDISDEEELATDIVQIITVFSARLNGKRAWENRKLREELSVHDNDGEGDITSN